ncbi:MAG: hypothetical protein ABFD16_16035, partial [Thermoguttaceae bacterium]
PLNTRDTSETWVRQFVGQVLRIREEAHEEPAGQITGWLVPLSGAPDAVNPFVAAEAQDQKCARLVRAVVDPVTNDLRDDLELQGPGEGVLCLVRVSLLPEFRGYNLDRAATWHILRWLGHGWKVAVAELASLSEPLGEEGAETSQVQDEALAEEQEELAEYWGQLGFRSVPGSSIYTYLDLSQLPGEAPRIRRSRR